MARPSYLKTLLLLRAVNHVSWPFANMLVKWCSNFERGRAAIALQFVYRTVIDAHGERLITTCYLLPTFPLEALTSPGTAPEAASVVDPCHQLQVARAGQMVAF